MILLLPLLYHYDYGICHHHNWLENIKILSEFAYLSEKEKVEIKSLKRGECLMFVGENHILTKIECSELEAEILSK